MYSCKENHNKLDPLVCLEDANEMYIDRNIFPQIYNANGCGINKRELRHPLIVLSDLRRSNLPADDI